MTKAKDQTERLEKIHLPRPTLKTLLLELKSQRLRDAPVFQGLLPRSPYFQVGFKTVQRILSAFIGNPNSLSDWFAGRREQFAAKHFKQPIVQVTCMSYFLSFLAWKSVLKNTIYTRQTPQRLISCINKFNVQSTPPYFFYFFIHDRRQNTEILHRSNSSQSSVYISKTRFIRYTI